MVVKRVERHLIKASNELYTYCDDICFKSKNLYNYANYLIRQEYIFNKNFTGFYELDRLLKEADQIDYRALPAQTSQQTLLLLDRDWQSFLLLIMTTKKIPLNIRGDRDYQNTKGNRAGI